MDVEFFLTFWGYFPSGSFPYHHKSPQNLFFFSISPVKGVNCRGLNWFCSFLLLFSFFFCIFKIFSYCPIICLVYFCSGDQTWKREAVIICTPKKTKSTSKHHPGEKVEKIEEQVPGKDAMLTSHQPNKAKNIYTYMHGDGVSNKKSWSLMAVEMVF